MRTRANNIAVALLAIILLSYFVIATPTGPSTLTVKSNERTTLASSPKTHGAQAGNVTQLLIDASSVTNYWQGYYGNVTGTITLDDGNNWTMFDWASPNPTGEVYASNSSISSWSEAICVNLSSSTPGFNCTFSNEECLNVTEIESHFGMNSTTEDGVNETFTSLINLSVGTKSLTYCPAIYTNVNDTNQSDYFAEAILSINNTETIIFAAILEDDVYGFNNETADFQMIVGEDGTDSVTTDYYFYVELS